MKNNSLNRYQPKRVIRYFLMKQACSGIGFLFSTQDGKVVNFKHWMNALLVLINDIGVEIIAMHYGIGWGGKKKSIPTRLMGNLVGILFVFPPIQYHNALR